MNKKNGAKDTGNKPAEYPVTKHAGKEVPKPDGKPKK